MRDLQEQVDELEREILEQEEREEVEGKKKETTGPAVKEKSRIKFDSDLVEASSSPEKSRATGEQLREAFESSGSPWTLRLRCR